MPSVSVTLPWVKDLTANHSKWQGRRTKKHVWDWQMALTLQLAAALEAAQPGWMMTPPVTVRVDSKEPRLVDQDNRAKIVWDAVKKATGIDDKHFVAERGSFEYAPAERAEITVTVKWGK